MNVTVHHQFQLDEEDPGQLILSLLVHLGGLTFSTKHGHLQRPNKLALNIIYNEVCRVYKLSKAGTISDAVMTLVEQDDMGPLCALLEGSFSAYRTEEDFNAHSERDTQQLLSMVLMGVTPVRLEVRTERADTKGDGYIDIVVTVPSAPPKVILIEVKNKQARWLDVKRSNTVAAKVDKIAVMPPNELRALKVSADDRYHAGKTLQQVMDAAGLQVCQYLTGITGDLPPGASVAAFVVLSVGSRRCLWSKCK